ITSAELIAAGATPGDNFIVSFLYSPGANNLVSRPADADTQVAVWYGNGTNSDFSTLSSTPNQTVVTGPWAPTGIIPGSGSGAGVMPADSWKVFNAPFVWTGGDVFYALQALKGPVDAGNVETLFVDDVKLVFPQSCVNSDSDSDIDAFDTDSDDDGCADAIEAGHTDPDFDGILGTSPVTVDANGLVIGQGGYTGTSSFLTDGIASFAGCMDVTACNYDAAALCDDGSCLFTVDACGNCGGTATAGCTDPIACNYDASAGCDNGSCVLPTGCETCSGETDGTGVVVDNDADGDGVCDADEIVGCQDATACNYNTAATDAAPCEFADEACESCSGEIDGSGVVVLSDADGDGVCDADEIVGCQDATACNYDATATDAGNCDYLDACGVCGGSGTLAGCMDSAACNYNAAADCDDGSCSVSLGLELGPDQDICAGDVVTLDAGAGYSAYLWSTGETTQTIDVNSAGTYTVDATYGSVIISQSDYALRTFDGGSIANPPVSGSGYSCGAMVKFPLVDDSSDNYWTLFSSNSSSRQLVVQKDGELGVYSSGLGFISCGYNTNGLSAGYHQLAISVVGGTATYYVDGVSVGTTTSLNGSVTAIGNAPGNNSHIGFIDNVWYSGDTFTPSQVAAAICPPTGPVSIYNFYYDLEEGSGTTINDVSGTGNNATLAGTVTWETDAAEDCVDYCVDQDSVTISELPGGCTDPLACNYDSNANCDDASCVYTVDLCDTCSGETDGTGTIVDNDADDDGVCNADEIAGCQDATACNYNVAATDAAPCEFADEPCESCSGETDGTGVVVLSDADGDGVCDADEIVGCQDATACNYNMAATDAGSCEFPGACDACSGETDGTGVVIPGAGDTEAPNAVCNDITVALDATGSYTLSQSDIDAIGAGSTDNCSDAGDLTFSVNNDTFGCGDISGGGSATYGLDFDGSGQRVEVSNGSSMLAGANAMTIEGWVFPRNTSPTINFPNFDHFFGWRNEVNCAFYIMQLSASTMEVRFRNGAGTAVNFSATGLVPNQWQHLALTYDGSTVSLYRNGVLLSSMPASGSFTTQTDVPLLIGQSEFGSFDYNLNGQVDEVRVWNVARTATQLQSSANACLTGSEPNLVARAEIAH
ncbi:MAG: LamG-like jellyroll fold domain-containing protein, partial [Bacteroidota bacterium]